MIRSNFTQSLGFKLSLLIAMVVLLGVSLAAGIFIAQDFQKTIRAEQNRLQNTTTAFAAASSGPMATQNTSALYQVLRGISDIQNATFISARNNQGATIAEIGGSVSLSGRDGAVDEQSIWSMIMADTLSAEATIWSSGAQIGTLSIHSDISWLRTQYKTNLILMSMTALFSALLIAACANWIINRALKPLQQISGRLIAMEQNPDLSARFDIDKNDEIGVLANAFNDAFKTIQQRDQAIRHHRDTLETTVEERTSELKIAADEARKANAAKSDFLATMSHEIRTPMNGMLVMAELLSASNLSNRQQRFAEVIARSGNSLLHIINDILDMSKIEAGKMELEEIPFSLSTLVEDTISLYIARAHEKELKIGMVISPEISNQYIGDPTRLGQVLSNLTNNALKFTESGGVTIRVTSGEIENNCQKLNIAVTDTGIGIAPEKLGAIFEAFSQADQTTTRNYGGTGLGLSISKRLTQAMNGKISATSVEGQGTTFSVDVTLPVYEAANKVTKPTQAFRIGVADSSNVTAQATIETLDFAGLKSTRIEQNKTDEQFDLVIVSGQDLSNLPQHISQMPILQMTDYGDAGSLQNDDYNVLANLTAPLTNVDIEKIITSLNNQSWANFDDDTAQQKTKLTVDDLSYLRVLAVDDNAVNREVLNEALSALNVKATFASDGREAVGLAAAQSFDIIFMDCSMPGMDGYQATAAIRDGELNTNTHIVALTAHVTGPAAEQWKSAGMDSYIAKPFTVSQLSNALSQAKPNSQTNKVAPKEQQLSNDDQLLSKDVLTMFETVSQTTGNDMKTKVFTIFLDQIDQSASELIECCETQHSTENLRSLAHALKSMCSSAGALQAQKLCDTIEISAMDKIWPDEAILQNLKHVIDMTKLAMEKSLSDIDQSESPAIKTA